MEGRRISVHSTTLIEGPGELRAAGRQQLDSYPFVILRNGLFKSTTLSQPPSVSPSTSHSVPKACEVEFLEA